MTEIRPSEIAAIETLREHPENYRRHPPGQIAHLVESMNEHGFYRNVIVASDGTILAGHGVVVAAKQAGLDAVSVVRMPFGPDDPRARKILVADNELMRLAQTDDAKLHALVSAIAQDDADLLGTGLTRDDVDVLTRFVEATSDGTPWRAEDEWGGMPPFRQDDRQAVFRTTIHFVTEEDATEFFERIGREKSRTIWWPEPDGMVGSNQGEAWVGRRE